METDVQQKAGNDSGVTEKTGMTACLSKKFQNYSENITSVYNEVVDMCNQVDCRNVLHRTCSLDNLRRKLPITQWLPKYRLRHLQGDFIAGITVGLMIIPQGLAYAKIAELPTQFGLYAVISHCFLYMLFGTSRDLSNGPCAIMSLLTSQFGRAGLTGDYRAAILLTFVTGIVQIFMAIINVGSVLDFVSHPVINSFTSAAAITILCSQIKKWLGLRKIPRSFIPQLMTIAKRLKETRIYDFILGLVCMILLYMLKRLRESKCVTSHGQTRCSRVAKYILRLACTARNAIVVMLATGLAAILKRYDLSPFYLTGKIESGIPSFQVPEFSWTIANVTYSATDNIMNLGAGIFIVPVVGVIESIAISKALGRKNNYNPVANQEIFALGITNLFGSFLSSFPVAGAFSRSAVNSQSGVQTPAGSIFTGSLILLSLAFLTPLFYYIPDSALAAVIMMAISSMIDFSMIPHMWAVKKLDLIPWFVTFIISLLIGVEYGLVVGVVLSLVPLLTPWSRPKLESRILNEDQSKTLILSIEMGLLFPAMDRLDEKIRELAFTEKNYKAVVMNLENVTVFDYVAVHGIQQLEQSLAKKNIQLVLCNLRPRLEEAFGRLKHIAPVVHSFEEALALLRVHQSDVILSKTSFTALDISNASNEYRVKVDTCHQDKASLPQDNSSDEVDKKPADLADVITE